MKITNIIKISLAAAFIIGAIYTAGCGASSAPPVDLPAPITGRIDVSAPDAEGNVTITGTDGAVPAGTTVVAVNEGQPAASLFRLIDGLVPDAYAAPRLCSEVGHACTVATAEGAFVLVIPAQEGDIILLGIIDPDTGDFISDTITVTVPASGTPEPQANCSGMGLSGTVVDVQIAPTSGVPVLLKQGSDTTTNELVLGASSPTTVPITGCYAHSLAIFPSSTGDVLAVTSHDDMILWTAKLVSGAITSARSFTLAEPPMHAAFVDSRTSLLVALKTSSSIEIASISLGTGDVLGTMLPQDSASSAVQGLARSLALDVEAMEQGTYQNNYLGLLITDTGTTSNAYVTVFAAATLEHKGTWSLADINAANPNAILDNIIDGALFVRTGGAATMEFEVLGAHGSASLDQVYTIYASVNKPLVFVDSIGANPALFVSPQVRKANSQCGSQTLRNLAISQITSPTITSPRGLISTASGTLCIDDLDSDNPPVAVTTAWTSGDDITALAVDDALKYIFGADNTTASALDGSSYYTW